MTQSNLSITVSSGSWLYDETGAVAKAGDIDDVAHGHAPTHGLLCTWRADTARHGDQDGKTARRGQGPAQAPAAHVTRGYRPVAQGQAEQALARLAGAVAPETQRAPSGRAVAPETLVIPETLGRPRPSGRFGHTVMKVH